MPFVTTKRLSSDPPSDTSTLTSTGCNKWGIKTIPNQSLLMNQQQKVQDLKSLYDHAVILGW